MKAVKEVCHVFLKLIKRLYYSFYKSIMFFAIVLASTLYLDELGSYLMSVGLDKIIWSAIVLIIAIPQLIFFVLALRNMVLSLLKFINPLIAVECIRSDNKTKVI